MQCSPLNPLLHSLPHSQTDESCEQSLEGWIEDPGCACVYLVAERNDDGCPAKFYALCQRFADKVCLSLIILLNV